MSKIGWCYKNGGVASFGYRIEHFIGGKDSKGKAILKAIWLLDDEKSPIVREVVVDIYIGKRMSYAEIRDELNKRNIKTNRGNTWWTASVVELLKEERLKTYAGYAIWNKTDCKRKGQRYKDKEEWIEIENAHSQIITEKEMKQALDLKQFNRKGAPAGRTRKSRFRFTGLNFEKDPIFCGGNFVSYQNHNTNYYVYKCGTNRFKGKSQCDNNVKINK